MSIKIFDYKYNKHMLCVGPTQAGKTTFVRNYIGDIIANNEDIDPQNILVYALNRDEWHETNDHTNDNWAKIKDYIPTPLGAWDDPTVEAIEARKSTSKNGLIVIDDMIQNVNTNRNEAMASLLSKIRHKGMFCIIMSQVNNVGLAAKTNCSRIVVWKSAIDKSFVNDYIPNQAMIEGIRAGCMDSYRPCMYDKDTETVYKIPKQVINNAHLRGDGVSGNGNVIHGDVNTSNVQLVGDISDRKIMHQNDIEDINNQYELKRLEREQEDRYKNDYAAADMLSRIIQYAANSKPTLAEAKRAMDCFQMYVTAINPRIVVNDSNFHDKLAIFCSNNNLQFVAKSNPLFNSALKGFDFLVDAGKAKATMVDEISAGFRKYLGF